MDNSHLRLQREQRPVKQRRPLRQGMRIERSYDYGPHATGLRDQARFVVDQFKERPRPTHSASKLMLRFELNRRVEDDDWVRAGMTVLDSSERLVAIVSADQGHLDRFLARLADYEEGPVTRIKLVDDELKQVEGSAHFEGFFDAIDSFRPLEAADRIEPPLQAWLDHAEGSISFDVELWFHRDLGVMEDWLGELRAVIHESGGEWLDGYVGTESGIAVARVRGAADVIRAIAELEQVQHIGFAPVAVFDAEQFQAFQDADELPEDIPEPPSDAALVGIVDTGIRAGHPLLQPAVEDVEALHPDFGGQGEDANGHGTAIAGVVVYGDVAEALQSGTIEPPFWLSSVRILDEDGHIPDTANWVRLVRDAVERLASDGASVINLSFAASATPYGGGKSSALAAELDTLARAHNVVLVVSAGNIKHEELAPTNETLSRWPYYLADPGYELLDPAYAASALTVGALSRHDALMGTTTTRLGLSVQSVATATGPAPFTRRGPGVRQAIKPELVAPGGNWAMDHNDGTLHADEAIQVISTSARFPDRLVEGRCGTSFAAARVSHLAGLVATEYPFLRANTIRALVAQSAVVNESLEGFLTQAEEPAKLARQLVGYGEPHAERTLHSTRSRVVMWAEDRLVPNDFHVYKIPETPAYMETAGEHTITVALAFTPPVRYRRYDYLGYEMDFMVVRGIDLDDVFALASANSEHDADSRLAKYEMKMQPARTHRKRGTCQVGTVTSSKRPYAQHRDDWYVVVQSWNKWHGTNKGDEEYSLTVTLDAPQATELRADLEARLELEIEAQAQAHART